MLATALGLNAQITSTHTDEKFGYTTVVYKEKAASDADVLSALDNSIGMGDVIRITVAPPKPAAAPLIDTSKGEDVWLNAKPAVANLSASTGGYISNLAEKKASETAPVSVKVAPIATVKTTAPAPKVVKASAPATPKKETVAASAPKTEMAVSPATPVAPKVANSNAAVKSKTTVKSAKKSVKKHAKKGGSHKVKRHKKGKQRYGCPKF